MVSHRGNAARVVNGGGDEELALAIDDERAMIVGHIASISKRESKAGEHEHCQLEQKGGELHIGPRAESEALHCNHVWEVGGEAQSVGIYLGKQCIE